MEKRCVSESDCSPGAEMVWSGTACHPPRQTIVDDPAAGPVYSVTVGEGIYLPNIADLVSVGPETEYTARIVFKMEDMDGWNRLINSNHNEGMFNESAPVPAPAPSGGLYVHHGELEVHMGSKRHAHHELTSAPPPPLPPRHSAPTPSYSEQREGPAPPTMQRTVVRAPPPPPPYYPPYYPPPPPPSRRRSGGGKGRRQLARARQRRRLYHV